jgi:hypothetical protein
VITLLTYFLAKGGCHINVPSPCAAACPCPHYLLETIRMGEEAERYIRMVEKERRGSP